MSAKRMVGFVLAFLGLTGMVAGSLVAGAADPAPNAAVIQLASAPAVSLGWLLGGLGIALSFLGILFIANARRAFY